MAGGPPKLSDEVIQATVEAYEACGRDKSRTAALLGMSRSAIQARLATAAAKGLLGTKPILPGFAITKTTAVTNKDGDVVREFIQHKPEHGDQFEVPAGHLIKGISALIDGSGNEIIKWVKTKEDSVAQQAAMEAVVAAFVSEMPRADPVILNARKQYNDDLLNQYTVTDYHFGLLSWGEETGADWDLKIAETLWINWFRAAIDQSPDAHTAILAQLGDLLHFDSLKAVTPAHGHVLDADSRFAKVVRVVIRCLRAAIKMLLEKHEHVHIIMADANHDEASEVWLREMFAATYENEPRITVDRSPSTYYAFEWGDVALFYHHGHKKKIKNVDKTFAGRNRTLYGKSKYAYGHTGHLHSDHVFSSELGIKVERHETLAAPSSYEANGGYHSSRSSKVITYHKVFGEVGRITLTPEMVRQ